MRAQKRGWARMSGWIFVGGLLLALWPAAARAQCTGCGNPSFARLPRQSSGAQPIYLMVTADFNGDGLPDLALGRPGPVGIQLSVQFGTAVGDFSPPIVQDFPFGFIFTISGMTAGDFDGDGVQDLIITTGWDFSLFLFRGLGNGTFQNPIPISMPVQPGFLATGDFNGDGKLDLAFLPTFSVTADLWIALGDGNGGFSGLSSRNVGTLSSLHVADLDGDGLDDIVVPDSFGSSLYIVRGVAAGPFAPPEVIPVGTGPEDVAIGDWNHDGHLDLAVTTFFPGLVVLIGNASGGLDPPVTIGGNTYPSGGMEAGDFNGDGNLDVVVTGAFGNLSLFAGNGLGGFAPQVPAGNVPNGLIAMDVNRDGITDLVGTYLNRLVVLPGQPDGHFEETVGLPGFVSKLAAADFDGDGRPDLVVLSDPVVYFVWNDPSGLTPDSGLFVGVAPRTLAAADLNGDGKADVLVVVGNQVEVFLAGAGRTFGSATLYDVGSFPAAISVADFNKDGIPDLAVANQLSGTVSILLGTGTGTFLAQVPYPTGPGPSSMAVADFNGDGKLDIAVTTEGSSVAILLGNGAGGFGSATAFPSGSFAALSMFAADLDGDSKVDLAVLNQALDGTVSVATLRGDGLGGFAAPVTIPLIYGLGASLTGADFNGDGRTDLLVVGGAFNGTGGVLLANDGSGGFPTQHEFFAARGAGSAAVADFDLDGLPDFALSSWVGPGVVSIFRNTNCRVRRLGLVSDVSSCAAPGDILGGPPAAALLDDGDNVVTCAAASVSAAIAPGTGPSGAVLGGANPVDTANGVATFSTLSIDTEGLGYQLEFHHPTLRSVRSAPFTVGLPPALPVVGNNGPICAGQTLQLTANAVAGGIYIWTGPNGFRATRQNLSFPAAQVSVSGTYSLVVSVNGCPSPPATTTAVINVVPSGSITAPSSTKSSSVGNAASVPDAGAGAVYSWSIAGGTMTGGTGTPAITFSAGSAGSIHLDVTVTMPSGCSASGSKTIFVSVVTGDLDGDGKSDLAWRNYSTGQNALWLMNGTSLKSIVDLPALANTNYHMEGMGDFNGDGKLDIVWRNYTTGQNAIWLMNGAALQSIVNLPSLPNVNYHIEAVGDLNHDGMADILWRNYATGQNAVWIMFGTFLGLIRDLPVLPNLNYRIGALADYSGDGKVDVVWRNYATGQNAVWVMNGTSLSGIVDLPALPNLNYVLEGKK